MPRVCRIAFDSALQDSGNGEWQLGRTREPCNSGDGYFVTATYAPDSLVGAVMEVGEREAVLDGSGQAVVYAGSGAANVSRDVAITPGEGGFDTDILTFAIQAA